MPSNDLNQAIQFIQENRPEEARTILQSIIQANPQDLEAWSWYVKSCSTPEKRIKALEMCLKFNPGNPQVTDAIQKLKEKLSLSQPSPASTSGPPALRENPGSMNMETYAAVAAAIPATVSAIELAAGTREYTGLDENPGRPFVWYDVWFKALTQVNVNTYSELLRDPLASPGRAYWWVFMTAMLTGLISFLNPSVLALLNQLTQTKDGENIGTILAVVLLLFVPVAAGMSVLGLILQAGLLNLLARMFGGSGNFSRMAYITGAYAAPFSVISGIISIIPLVNCLSILLLPYSFWLSVTSIQAAQQLNGGRATIVVLLPSLVIVILACLIGIAVGPALLRAIPTPSSLQ